MIAWHLVFLFAISFASASIVRRAPLSPITWAGNLSVSSTAENVSLQLSRSATTYVCGGDYYGRGEFAASCDEALRTMAIVPGPARQQFTWGERSMGQYDVPLPQRWMSC